MMENDSYQNDIYDMDANEHIYDVNAAFEPFDDETPPDSRPDSFVEPSAAPSVPPKAGNLVANLRMALEKNMGPPPSNNRPSAQNPPPPIVRNPPPTTHTRPPSMPRPQESPPPLPQKPPSTQLPSQISRKTSQPPRPPPTHQIPSEPQQRGRSISSRENSGTNTVMVRGGRRTSSIISHQPPQDPVPFQQLPFRHTTSQAKLDLPLECQPWFHGQLDRLDAEAFMDNFQDRMYLQDGTFMVRQRIQHPMEAPYALTIFHRNKYYHLEIRQKSSHSYSVGKKKANEDTFNSIPEMVEHYKTNELYVVGREGLSCTTLLTLPCPK